MMKMKYVKILYSIGLTLFFVSAYARVADETSVSAKPITSVSKRKIQMYELKKLLYALRNHPAVRAFLDTIALAELGRANALSSVSYIMMYPSGKTFKGFDHHPGVVNCAQLGGREICSSAAGRYMFLEKIWKKIAHRLDLHDFSPLNQDIAAIYLLYEKKALEDIQKRNLKAAIAKVNTIWSSLPGSPHKQPVRKYKKLEEFFKIRYAHYAKYLKGKEWA